MEYIGISPTPSGFRMEGFPNAERLIRLEGREARRLADLSLHKADLEFADNCLDAISSTPESNVIIREALWTSAIVYTFKCFGKSEARFQLSAQKILKDQPPVAITCFNHLKAIRDKHMVHDENAYAQAIPGAVLNKREASRKIERVVCANFAVLTIDPGNFGNMKLIITQSRSWVLNEFDKLCEAISENLEKLPYEDLHKRPAFSYVAPDLGEASLTRGRP